MRTAVVAILIGFCFIACGKDGKSFLGLNFGTSDSGGGNGAGNKVYESYIVDPANLAAYKKYVSPLEGGSPDERRRWLNFLRYKTWYVAPVELQEISKDTLGVSFSEDQTQQLAIQTSKEIWIKASTFNTMSERDQANLIIHELVMSLYFIKYKSMTDFCHLLHKGIPGYDCRPMSELDELYPERVPQPLNVQDYQNIRRVTAFFIEMTEGRERTSEEIIRVLRENHFDSRLTALPSDHPPSKVPEEITLSSFNLTEVFEQLKAVNALPDKCNFVEMGVSEDCYVDVFDRSEEVGNTGVMVTYSVMGISPKKTAERMSEESFIRGLPLKAIRSQDTDGNDFYLISLVSKFKTEPEFGDRFRSTFLRAEINPLSPERSLKVNAVVSIPGVIIRVVKDGNGKTLRCDTDRPKARTPAEDVIVVTREDKHLPMLKWIAKRMPAHVICQ